MRSRNTSINTITNWGLRTLIWPTMEVAEHRDPSVGERVPPAALTVAKRSWIVPAIVQLLGIGLEISKFPLAQRVEVDQLGPACGDALVGYTYARPAGLRSSGSKRRLASRPAIRPATAVQNYVLACPQGRAAPAASSSVWAKSTFETIRFSTVPGRTTAGQRITSGVRSDFRT